MEKKNSPKVYVKFSLSSLSLPFLCFFFFSSFSRKKSLCSPPCSSPCSSFFYVQKSLLHSSLQAAISARPKRSPPSLGSLFFSYFSPQNLPLCSALFPSVPPPPLVEKIQRFKCSELKAIRGESGRRF